MQTNCPLPRRHQHETALGHAGVWDVHRSIVLAPAPRQRSSATAFPRPRGTFFRRAA